MAQVTDYLDEPGRLRYPGMIVPEATRKSEWNNEILLPDLTVEERIQKYFEFCRAFDKREDPVLRDHFQQHSHRLHWQEHPYVEAIKGVKSLKERIRATLVFSFTNEHWETFMACLDSDAALKKRLEDPVIRNCRSDLFQIYYPKDTNVGQFLYHGTKMVAEDMEDITRYRNSPWGMMNLAKHYESSFKKLLGFRTVLYPCKNFSRYMAMGSPALVNPESYIHPGTGSFRGFHQIFGGKYLMASAKYAVDHDGNFVPQNKDGQELWRQFGCLIGHKDNPVRAYNYINHEDKACFFFKRLAYEAGVQKATKSIPYSWIFPKIWNLRTGNYDRDPSTPENMI
jgi:hypothetical protein